MPENCGYGRAVWPLPRLAAESWLIIGQEHHVFPMGADVLPLCHHISGQTILHAAHPLPAVLNWEAVRGIGDRPAASLGVCGGNVRKGVAGCSTFKNGQIRPTPR